MGDDLLEDEWQGLAEVHVEDVERFILHDVRMEERPVRPPVQDSRYSLLRA